MYTLFSPSEGKKLGGNHSSLRLGDLLFPPLDSTRLPLLKAYNNLMHKGSLEELQTMTGVKKEDEIKKYQDDIFSSPCMPALERYDGVAYDYLDLASLSQEESSYLYAHTIIFSNLFGPLHGGDMIPAYKLKQGASVDGVATEKVYKEASTEMLDELLQNELILDLRAGYYEKFYTLKQPFITMKFLKDGKSVSHWAKAYRGKVLRTIANIQPQTKEELLKIDFDGLQFIESTSYKKNGTMLIYEVN